MRGASRALGIAGPVTSPTYTIGHRYPGRVPSPTSTSTASRDVAEDDWGDLEPYFEDAVVFVEWPERGAALPRARAQRCGCGSSGPSID